ncbi:MAG TPA: proton-conducting transporter membrane subunit, partial [Anaerolineae bacterium]
MTIGGSMLLIIVPLMAAALTVLLRRSGTVSALLAIIVPLGLAVIALRFPLDEPQAILGRIVVLETGDRIAIAFLFMTASAIFLSVWRSSPGWAYYPVGLAILSLLAGALIIRPPLNEVYPSFVYSALFIAIASVLCVFPLQGGAPGRTSGVTRFIIVMSLALPALLLADWALGRLTQSPDSPDLTQATILLVAVSFTLLLAIFPFHTWVPAVSREAPPLSTAFALNILLGAVVILLLDVLNGVRLVGGDPRMLELLRGAGLIMVGLGAVLAWTQIDLGRLLAYGALADMGAILFAIGLASPAGLAAAFIMLIVRALSTGLMAMGMMLARERYGGDSFAKLRGLIWRLPWASLAIIAGGLSLAGLPP